MPAHTRVHMSHPNLSEPNQNSEVGPRKRGARSKSCREYAESKGHTTKVMANRKTTIPRLMSTPRFFFILI